MPGFAVGSQCIRDQAEAAASACSAISGVTSAGVVSCSAPALAGGGLLSYTLNTDGATSSSRAVSVQLQPCEPQDWEFYEPIVGLWFVAMVTVLCARMLYQRTFPSGNA